MTDIAAILGVVAATLAAGFSGAGLYLSGRREERRWRREALLDGYQRLVELSFDRSFAAVQGIRARAHLEQNDVEELRRTEEERHTEFDSLVTRLRLLAAGSVVDAAVELHLRDNQLVELALGSSNFAGQSDLADFDVQRELNRRAKEKMLLAARNSLGLEGVEPIDERWWGTSSTA